jgi:hypothetical protein
MHQRQRQPRVRAPILDLEEEEEGEMHSEITTGKYKN